MSPVLLTGDSDICPSGKRYAPIGVRYMLHARDMCLRHAATEPTAAGGGCREARLAPRSKGARVIHHPKQISGTARGQISYLVSLGETYRNGNAVISRFAVRQNISQKEAD